MSLEVGGDRIIDLGAGIGRLAWHNRNLYGRWPYPTPEFLCVERNPAYVRVGKVMPEATRLCADILDLPDLADQLGGMFDCAISNPPFGPPRRHRNAPGYAGRRFEYHTIAVAARLSRRGVFIVPQLTDQLLPCC
jgi:predicted RNA methylase